MSALRQPDFPNEYYALSHSIKKASNLKQAVVVNSSPRSSKTLHSTTFPQTNNLPRHLQVLSLLQKGSFGLALVSMATSISLYISTVQIPKLWSQEYQNLENLQRQERQLIAINETIKYQIAQEAGKNSNLTVSTPESALFISPAQVSIKTMPEQTRNQQKRVELKYNNLGY
ncbi:hypothetical protein [Pleurocapsa sp. PCC 7319]|uniref:hypothetical protein n=1 Tax=Pleurocapsa sp. PCC 7319 TaxID=118161 RepID=UPI0003462059|nr:hypothetical protein [Pleurocapsa sp. PCC 7319]